MPWFGGTGRRRRGSGRELADYRAQLVRQTLSIDELIGALIEAIDALRRRDMDVDEALDRLTSGEERLDAATEELRGILAPAELHPLHMEYEANLERATRGVVTAVRGCALTKQRHRAPDDEEPFTYWKRGQQNMQHARLRMSELTDALRTWEPGAPAEASVAARLHRAEAEE
jgi:exonuclease VII small subunit